jgi:hypothetical protein
MGQALEQQLKEARMNRVMIVARLQEGVHDEAEALLATGPPFDPEELGFHCHAAYLTSGEVVFLFEAPEVEWMVNDIINDPVIAGAFGPWYKLIDGTPRLAHERYYWAGEPSKLKVGLGV